MWFSSLQPSSVVVQPRLFGNPKDRFSRCKARIVDTVYEPHCSALKTSILPETLMMKKQVTSNTLSRQRTPRIQHRWEGWSAPLLFILCYNRYFLLHSSYNIIINFMHFSYKFSGIKFSNMLSPKEHLHVLQTNRMLIWAATWENQIFAYAKTKTQISFGVTAFVFATQIVQSLSFLNTEFQASSHLQWFPSPVCVRPGQKTRTGFLRTRLILQPVGTAVCKESITIICLCLPLCMPMFWSDGESGCNHRKQNQQQSQTCLVVQSLGHL